MAAGGVYDGCFSAFRAQSLRPVDHRWVLAASAYEAHVKTHGTVSSLGRRDIWHSDPVIQRLIRAQVIARRGNYRPDISEIRSEDVPVLAAVDLSLDSGNLHTFHIVQCMLLGGATDVHITDYLHFSDPDIVRYTHEGFFDVRSRRTSALLMGGLLFPQCAPQGGHSPLDTERISAWLFGHEWYLAHYQYREVASDMRDTLVRVLQRNQELMSIMRRRLGFESIEAIAAAMNDRVMLDLKSRKDSEGDTTAKRLTAGLNKLVKLSGGVQVVDEDTMTSRRIERPSVMVKLQSAQKEPHHAQA